MNGLQLRSPKWTLKGGLAHFGATIVFWLAAGVGIGHSETGRSEGIAKL